MAIGRYQRTNGPMPTLIIGTSLTVSNLSQSEYHNHMKSIIYVFIFCSPSRRAHYSDAPHFSQYMAQYLAMKQMFSKYSPSINTLQHLLLKCMNTRLDLGPSDCLGSTRSTRCRHFHFVRLIRLHFRHSVGKMPVEFVDSVIGIRQLVL